MIHKKYLGGRVSKHFDDEGNVRKYIGDVHFIPYEVQYLIHVSYLLSDDDSEDLEEWQVGDL